ncbi:MAG: hypothetical protein LBQ22_01570 [Bacteroidales bacterium]|jgi:hypothetical protein|nr:hypothetical protein [Bacteroidales bacterium]
MIKKIFISFFILLLLFVISCGKKDSLVVNDEIVASIGNEYLFRKDIIKLLPDNVTPEDSAVIINNYIEEWLVERLIYQEALQNLEDTAGISDKIKNYHRQLYTYYYIDQILNTDYKITEEEINEYYQNNLEDYVLKSTCVKAHYLIMDANVSSYYDVLEKVWTSTLADEEALKDYCKGTNKKVYFIKEWMPIKEFFNLIHYTSQILDHELSYISVLDYVEGDKRFIVKIDDYILKGQSSPLDFVREDIIQIIINNRKRDKYIRMKNNLVEEAVKSGVIILK